MENENMRICPRCGTPIANGQGFCGNCGAPLEAAFQSVQPAPVIQSEKDFYNAYASKNTKNFYTIQIVLCFISAFVSLIFALFVTPLSWVDTAFYGILAVWMLIRKDRLGPIIVLAYTIFAIVLSLMNHNVPGGILPLIIAVILTKSLNKLHKAYLEYLDTGVRPTTQF